MIAIEGVCRITGDRTPWANFVWGLGMGICLAAVVCASIIAVIRHGRREWTP